MATSTIHANAVGGSPTCIASMCVAALLVLSSASSAADIVHLSNGDILEGKITEETDRHLRLEVNRGSVWIPRAEVAMIRRDQAPTPLSLARLKELAEQLKRASEPKADGAAEEAKPATEGTTTDPRKLKAMRDALAGVRSKDPKEREEARNRVRAFGRDAIPVLAPALSDPSTYVRTLAADLLGNYNAREAVQSLLMALSGAVPDARKVRPWQRGFVRTLNVSLKRITGQSFDVDDRAVKQDSVVRKYLEWWDGTKAPGGEDAKGVGACVAWDTPQVGEAPLPEDDPERERKIWETRRIGPARYVYSPPRSFTDGVDGGR
jgi:hypothetical protein